MKRYGKYIIVAVMVAVLCITSITSGINVNAEDATKPVEIISIDYDNMTISLKGEDDTEFIFLTAARKYGRKYIPLGRMEAWLWIFHGFLMYVVMICI